jgi:SAM-dependent methyltransferase
MSIFTHTYDVLRTHYDEVLNKDKGTYKNSNDEPTPMGCIEEILAHIPADFWARTDTRIMDPCCGNGNWHLAAWNMMSRHQPQSTPAQMCAQYEFNDINEARLKNVRTVFGADARVTTADFLAAVTTPRFDMVFANPPYAKFMEDGARASKNHTMTRDFLRASLQHLKPDGYLVFLIPDNWMSLADRNDVPALLTRYKFIHLNIHGAKKWFPKVGSSFTWFILQKTDAGATDAFVVEHPRFPPERVNAQVRDYVPLVYNETIRSILNKTIDGAHARFGVETSSDLHKYTKRALISATPAADHPYRLIHTPKQTVYSTRPHKFQEGWKAFLSTTDTYRAFADECGMTQSIAFVRCASREAAVRVAAYLNHDLYVFLNNICRWGNFNSIRILQRFPKPDDMTATPYDAFALTKEERDYIGRAFDIMRWKRPNP